MIKNKKIFLVIFLVIFGSICFSNFSYSEDNICKYTEKIDICVNSKSKRAIEDFICTEGTRGEIIYQIALDEKFSEIDNKIENYLNKLELEKNKFFGPEAQFTYFDAVDEIEKKFNTNGYYYYEYKNICGVELIKEVQSCQSGSINVNESKEIFKKSTCMDLAETKLKIYKQVAYDILMLNKASVRKDFAKKYVQQERTKYDKLLDLMMVNIGYMERIFNKTTLFTRNPM